MCVAAKNFVYITNTWIEQRNFIYLAIDALQNHTVVRDIQAAMSELAAKEPDLTSMLENSFLF